MIFQKLIPNIRASLCHPGLVALISDYTSINSGLISKIPVVATIDGNTWYNSFRSALNDTNVSSAYYIINYNNLYYISGGAGLSVAVSPDLEQWTVYDITTAFTGWVNTIYAAAGMIIATLYDSSGNGINNCSAVSTDDGQTWTLGPAFDQTVYMPSIIYANNQFIACKSDGSVVTSADGLNWTLLSSLPTTILGSSFYGVYLTLINNILYASCTSYDNGTNTTIGGIFASNDYGVTWSNVLDYVPNSGSSNEMLSTQLMLYPSNIAYNGSVYVVGDGSTSSIAVSTDGINWEPRVVFSGITPNGISWIEYFGDTFYVGQYNPNTSLPFQVSISNGNYWEYSFNTSPSNQLYPLTTSNAFIRFTTFSGTLPNSMDLNGDVKLALTNFAVGSLTKGTVCPMYTPVISIEPLDAMKYEGSAGLMGSIPFTFTLSKTSNGYTGTSAVTYTVAGIGPNSVDNLDFAGDVIPPTETVIMTSTTNSTILSFNIKGDTDIEQNEQFSVTLTDPQNAQIMGNNVVPLTNQVWMITNTTDNTFTMGQINGPWIIHYFQNGNMRAGANQDPSPTPIVTHGNTYMVGGWIAGDSSGDPVLAHISRDAGYTWTTLRSSMVDLSSLYSQTWIDTQAAIYAFGQYMLFSLNNAVITSNDGITWNPATPIDPTFTYPGANGRGIYLHTDGYLYYYSDLEIWRSNTGNSWTKVYYNNGPNQIVSLTGLPNGWLLVVYNDNPMSLSISVDGVNWTNQINLGIVPASDVVKIIYGNNKIIILAGDVYVADDNGLFEFTHISFTLGMYGNVWLRDIAFNSIIGTFVTVDYTNGNVYYSTDGTSWIPQPQDNQNLIHCQGIHSFN